jgi:hypothetical protein
MRVRAGLVERLVAVGHELVHVRVVQPSRSRVVFASASITICGLSMTASASIG